MTSVRATRSALACAANRSSAAAPTPGQVRSIREPLLGFGAPHWPPRPSPRALGSATAWRGRRGQGTRRRACSCVSAALRRSNAPELERMPTSSGTRPRGRARPAPDCSPMTKAPEAKSPPSEDVGDRIGLNAVDAHGGGGGSIPSRIEDRQRNLRAPLACGAGPVVVQGDSHTHALVQIESERDAGARELGCST